jgi:hypothetical protein
LTGDFWSAKKYLSKPNNWWLMDQEEHGAFSSTKCHIILTSSGNKENYNEFKNSAKKLYMPSWDHIQGEDTAKLPFEYEGYWRVFHPTTTYKDVVDCVNYWGYVPRRLANLDITVNDEKTRFDLSTLHAAIKICDINSIVMIMNSEEYLAQSSQSMLTYEVDREYYSNVLQARLASKFVERSFCERSIRYDLDSVRSFLLNAYDDASLSSFYGYVFEKFARLSILRGEQLRYRELGKDSTTDVDKESQRLQLPELSAKEITSYEDILTLDQSTYGDPSVSNFAVVDGVWVDKSNGIVYGFQMSKSADHGYSLNGTVELLEVMKKLNCSLYLVLMVPDHTYSSVRFQKYLNEDGTRAKQRVDKVKDVRRFTATIEFSRKPLDAP